MELSRSFSQRFAASSANWNGFSYHSLRVVGGFSQVITCFCNGVGSVSLKKSITAVESNRPDQVTNILNLATCSLMLLLLAICKRFISSRVSPGPSKGSNDFLIVSLTSLKVPNVKLVLFFSSSLHSPTYSDRIPEIPEIPVGFRWDSGNSGISGGILVRFQKFQSD